MSNYRIAVLVGSLRRDSYNRRLASALATLAPSEFSFEQLRIDDLPLYNQDDDGAQTETVMRLKAGVTAAQGLIVVTPEHNRAMPAALKNAIDHGSRPYGQSVWAGKPAGVIGASPGQIGTAIAQQQLRNILAHLDVPTMGQPEAFVQVKPDMFDEAGNIGNAGTRTFLQRWVDRYVAWVVSHAA